MDPDPKALAEAIAAGDRRALARAITLVESRRVDHRRAAVALAEVLPHRDTPTLRLGISGAPGVGKSTFIEAFGLFLIGLGHRVAVLAVDPSSALGGGAILGDKTRMPELARHDQAFIRPSPSGGTLGGVARRTQETIAVCEAAGYDLVVVETVGVGQSEFAVRDMVDMFLLLVAPAAGDELQGLKRGIVEIADLVLVNKDDGDLAAAAQRTRAEYHAALGLLRPGSPGWSPAVLTCSALDGRGLDAIWEQVTAYRRAMTDTGAFLARRAEQRIGWMWADIADSFQLLLQTNPRVAKRLPALETAVADGTMAAPVAAQALLDAIVDNAEGET